MDASHINPFIQGAQNVFKTLCKETPSLGQVFIKKSPYSSSPVTTTLRIVGDIEGEVIYNMQETDALYMASLMMMGMPVSSLDEISKSAVSELTNMISGNVATLFFSKGIKIDITPPKFRVGADSADFAFAGALDKIVCVPLKFVSGNTFEVDIAFP